MDWYQLVELAKTYPNYGATILGVIGVGFSTVMGYFLKRPMTMQAVKADEFKTIIAGMQVLINTQKETIAYLEKLQREHDRDRDHWYRTRAQFVLRVEQLEARLLSREKDGEP